MKAIILARVSTEEQKEAGNSLPAQVARVKDYIERNKELEFGKEFTFDESAYKEGRQKFDDVIEYIEKQNEIVALICDKVDRLVRDFMTGLPKIEKLRRAGKIELHFPSDNLVLHQNSPATDLFHFNIAVSLAQYYSDAISDNTKRALEHKLKKGEWIGQPRIGYIKVVHEDGTKDLDIDPDRGHLVLKLFELFSSGNYSVMTAKDELNKLGLRSRNNNKLSPSSVHKMLRDKFYIGIMTSKQVEYPHKYAKIVSRELFGRVQDVLDSHNKKPVQYASKPFAFRGLIECKKCQGTITGEKKKGKYVYYSCSNYKGMCQRMWVKEEDLLKQIRTEIFDQIKVPQDRADKIVEGLKEATKLKNQFHHKVTTQLRNEYEGIQGKLDRLIDLLVDGSITKDVYDNKMKDYKERQYEIGFKLDQHTKADEDFHITASTVFSLANRASEIFESSEPREKQQLLNYLLQNCVLNGRKLEFALRSPYKTIVDTRHQPILLRGSDSNRQPTR